MPDMEALYLACRTREGLADANDLYMLSMLTPEEREIWNEQAEVFYQYTLEPGVNYRDLSPIDPQLIEVERKACYESQVRFGGQDSVI